MYKVEFSPKSIKCLERIPEKIRNRLIKAAEALAENPLLGKKMKGDLSDLRSLKVWPYRLLYKVRKKQLLVFIVTVGHRQNIYG
jgi:addiction module RelE/StbE family toxin